MEAPNPDIWEPMNKVRPREAFLISKRGKLCLGSSGKLILWNRTGVPPVYFWGAGADFTPWFKDAHKEIDEAYSIDLQGPTDDGKEDPEKAKDWKINGISFNYSSEETAAFQSFQVWFDKALVSEDVDAHPFTLKNGTWVKTITAEKAWQLAEDALSLARANSSSSSGTFDPPDFTEAEAFEDAYHSLHGNEYGRFDISAKDEESFWGTVRFPRNSDTIKVEGAVSVDKYYYAHIFGVLGRNGVETKLLLDADFSFREANITGPFKFKLALFKVKDSYDNTEFMSYDPEDMRLPKGQWEEVTPSAWTEFDSELFEEGEYEGTFFLSIKDLPLTIVANKVYAMRIVITSKTEVSGTYKSHEYYASEDGFIYHDQSNTYVLQSYVWTHAAIEAGITLRAATS